MRSAIRPEHRNSPVVVTESAGHFHCGSESRNLGETAVVVDVLDVLARDFDVIEFAMVEV